VRAYPAFYDVLNNACSKKHAEIEQHLYAMQNAQNDAASFDNSRSNATQANNSVNKGSNQSRSANVPNKGNADQKQQAQQQQQRQNQKSNNADKTHLISSQQRDQLQTFINERGLDVKSACEYLGIDALTHIEASKFEAVKNDINKFAREVMNG